MEFLEFILEDFLCLLQDEFSAVITKALMTLVHGLETKFDAEMAAMTRVPWSALESVGDQSEYAYMNSIDLLNLLSLVSFGRCFILLSLSGNKCF